MKKTVIAIIIFMSLCSNVMAGTYMFRDRASSIGRWLEAKGMSGSTYDKLYSYFMSTSGLSSGTLYDHVDKTLSDLGYTGTMRDKLDSFFYSHNWY